MWDNVYKKRKKYLTGIKVSSSSSSAGRRSLLNKSTLSHGRPATVMVLSVTLKFQAEIYKKTPQNRSYIQWQFNSKSQLQKTETKQHTF